VNYDKNIFVADSEGASNIKSKVASLSFKSGSKTVDVNNTESPIIIKLSNKPEQMKRTNISLYMPGKVTIHAVKLKSVDCQLLLNLNPANDVPKKTRLHVYVQYGRPPTIYDYDFQFVLSPGRPLNIIKSSPSNNMTTDDDDVTQERRVTNVDVIDDRTLFMWSFDKHKYGSVNRTVLYLALHYDGPMPDVQRLDNPYTFDILEKRGMFNYSLVSFCAECSYWNTEQAKWKSDGCEVTY